MTGAGLAMISTSAKLRWYPQDLLTPFVDLRANEFK
jgi:hypothetical protein